MLDRFDWLRLCRTGAELLATLQLFADDPEFPAEHRRPGPPSSALHSPCRRCWIYPCSDRESGAGPCAACQEVLARAWQLGDVSRQAVLLWGRIQPLPRLLRSEGEAPDDRTLGAYVHDEQRFLVALPQRRLKPWLQELVLYHGADLKGFLQIFRTVGDRSPSMGELLCRIVHGETRFPMRRLQVRFYSRMDRLFNPQRYDREGVLTFDIADFLSTLEMAAVFRTVLRPEEQKALYELLQVEDPAQAKFYWGRLLGRLNQEARDMLAAWNIRQWSRAQIQLLYELVRYVTFYSSS